MKIKFSRRRFLTTSAGALGAIAMPHLSRAADRPAVTHGVQSGDVTVDGGVVWARTDRPAQMLVEVATTESFKDARALPPIAALPESDFTAKMLLENLPGGQDIFYRVRFRDLSHTAIEGEPVVGRFRTAPADRRDVSFVWGGDVAGQGWGINPDDGGMFTFSAMRKHRPDFFLHSGDTIYADGPIPSEVKLEGGKIWKNVTIPEKAKVAETLDEYRAAHKYNLTDDNVRAFNAEVPIFVQWDDHEVTNNWSPSKELPATYKERDITLLAARAGRSSTRCIRCARASSSPAASTARSPMVRISTCSCSTSAAIAARTAPISKPPTAPPATSSGRTRSPGSSAASSTRARPGR